MTSLTLTPGATTLAQLPVHDIQLAIVTHGTLHQGLARRLT